MHPEEVTEITGKQLALIAQDKSYAIQKKSTLNDQKWQAFRTRVVAEGLARSFLTDEVQLTAEGHEIASRSPQGYTRFRRKRERELGDTLLTNAHARYGAWATIAATAVSIMATCIAYEALIKPDSDDKKVEKLENTQTILKARIDSLSTQQHLLVKKQDSLAHLIASTTHPATPIAPASDVISTPKATRTVQGKKARRN
jgi:hypothetical protein